MKIAFIGQKGIPTLIGGVERHVEELAVRMADQGHAVFVYARANFNKDKVKEYKGVKIITVPSIATKNLNAITYTLLASIHAIFAGYDVIHYQAIGPSSLSFIAKWFTRKTAVISTFHCQDYYHKKWGFLAKIYLKLSEALTCKVPDRTIAISKSLKSIALNQYNRNADLITSGSEVTIDNGTDEIEKWNLEPKKYFYMAPRFVKHKGIHYAIEAFNILDNQNKIPEDFRLVITGDGAYTDDYVQYVKKLAAGNSKVIFTGRLSGKPLRQLFSNAYTYLNPSENEGLSVALLETMGYGVASISSDIPENLEAVINNALIFENANVKDLAGKMEYAISNPGEMQSIAKRAQEHVEKTYSWDKSVKQTLKLYEEVLNKKRNPITTKRHYYLSKTMAKKYSLKFWISFWLIAAVLLTGWFVFLQFKNKGISAVGTPVQTIGKIVPTSISGDGDDLSDLTVFGFLMEKLFVKDNVERTYLVKLLNNLEIRPGGGFIGQFAIIKVKNGEMTDFQVHDLTNFDGRVPNTVEPPYPITDVLGIDYWKMRDSNFSPDFKENAEKAEYFYHLGGGQEELAGVFSVNTNVLVAVLNVLGPVKVEGYPEEYTAENAILTLEYQVEKGYVDQGLPKGDRKVVLNHLGDELIKKIKDSNISMKIDLYDAFKASLDSKNIQLFFKDEELQKVIQQKDWDGTVDTAWSHDYIMTVDANLNALKSDYYIKRSLDYTLDLTKEKPEAVLKWTYEHTGKEKNWMTTHYHSYLRVYLPEGAWIQQNEELANAVYGNQLGKKYIGSLIFVPLGETKTYEFRYTLPESVKDDYMLKIQKQSGTGVVPANIKIKYPDGSEVNQEIQLEKDMVIKKAT